MGLYDYRPYVKKVINNKQIMYDCDKGYVLENGPVSVSVKVSNETLKYLILIKFSQGQHASEVNGRRRSFQNVFLVNTQDFDGIERSDQSI